jgi:Arc/MetJ family transcription regulator
VVFNQHDTTSAGTVRGQGEGILRWELTAMTPVRDSGCQFGARQCPSRHQRSHYMMYHSASFPRDTAMRTTINLDEALLDEARRVTGLTERAVLIREGLKALIERESARRLARLGGSEPRLKAVPRRRPKAA